jgi:hypothetical protein
VQVAKAFITLNENGGSPSAGHKIEDEVDAQAEAEVASQKTSEAALWVKIGDLCPLGKLQW